MHAFNSTKKLTASTIFLSIADDDVVEVKQDNFGQWNKVADKKKAEPGPAEIQQVTMLEEEASVSTSMVAALKLAAKKGYLDEGKEKKPSGVGLAALRARSYTIEDKGSMDDEGREGRRRGRDLGERSGPLMDFKEKDNYKPDIKLDYIDDQGRKLSSKEAFRYDHWPSL
jgi:U4/U6.U5 tri-snRNP-associated protein 1